jgi:DNA-binding MarR family transcriptional regulator
MEKVIKMSDVTALYYAIKEKSDAITTLLLQEIREMLGEEYQELTQKQVMLLDLLKHRSLTVNEIAEAFSITASAASQLIKKLEEKKYVRRNINEGNRREIIVSLDETGKAYNEKVDEVELRLMNKYYGKLNRDDLVKLKEITDKLYEIIIKEHQS